MDRLIRFVEANRMLHETENARLRAERAYKAADREFRDAWDAMPKREQRKLQAAYDARAAGCICPRADNWRGSPQIGRERGWVIVVGCPLHSPHSTADEAS